MKKNIIIVWAWLHAEVVKNIISYNKNYSFYWYLDDIKKWKDVIWTINDIDNYIENYYFICAIWDNNIRWKIFELVKNKWWKFINAIHPESFIEKSSKLWEWIMIWAKVYINIDTKIWDNSIINNWVIIEHHNKIWKNCHLAPWVITWWSVNIWDNVFLGLNTLIFNNIYINDKNIIWAWSLVNKDILETNIKWFWLPFNIK